MKKLIAAVLLLPCLVVSCGSGKKNVSEDKNETEDVVQVNVKFDSDSAFSYLKRQVDFGPRINNTQAHRLTGDYLEKELSRHGAKVVTQEMTLRSFDGVDLKARNIMGQYNPEASDRLLLLAHWDTRPWADEEKNEDDRKKPVDGANDGASGVGVLLEIARQLGISDPGRGVDILFVDAEDRGASGDEESWALGARYFAANPIIPGYAPKEAVLLDMVGGTGARFPQEYFSALYASGLLSRVWRAAADAGYSSLFVTERGGGITDDHLQLINAGIPTIDVIDLRQSGSGFYPGWHTLDDNLEGIDRDVLKAVGQTMLQFIYGKY